MFSVNSALVAAFAQSQSFVYSWEDVVVAGTQAFAVVVDGLGDADCILALVVAVGTSASVMSVGVADT